MGEAKLQATVTNSMKRAHDKIEEVAKKELTPLEKSLSAIHYLQMLAGDASKKPHQDFDTSKLDALNKKWTAAFTAAGKPTANGEVPKPILALIKSGIKSKDI